MTCSRIPTEVVVFELDFGVAGDHDDRHSLDLHTAVELVDVASDDFVERNKELLAGFETGIDQGYPLLQDCGNLQPGMLHGVAALVIM